MSAQEEVQQINKELDALEQRDEERFRQALQDRERQKELRLRLNELQSRPDYLPQQSSQQDKGHGINSGIYFGVDIGGTLAKLVFFEPEGESNAAIQAVSAFITSSAHYGSTGLRVERLAFAYGDGRFHFIHFETRRMANAVDLLTSNKLHESMTQVNATGGGAYKFAPLFEDKAQIKFVAHDELGSMVRGLLFLVREFRGELYTHLGTPLSSPHQPPEVRFLDPDQIFPFIVVNIGSGVSILHVESDSSYERVNGTALGGATYLGLSRLLTGCETFEDALKLAESGHSSNIDLLVGDIYGGRGIESLGLPAHATAACFGKMTSMGHDDRAHLQKADFARALLLMISNNIGQIAHLTAQHYKTKHIVFAGSFLRHNLISQRALAYATSFWSNGEREALFLTHEGFCGALGCLLHTLPFHTPHPVMRRNRAFSLS